MTAQPTFPLLDESHIKSIFGELTDMDVALDPDPLIYGPKRLNEKVAKVRGMLSRTERLFLQVSHDLQLCKRSHRSEELDFDLQVQDMLANDPEVRAGRNVRDRDALATMKLRDQRERLMGLEVGIQDHEMVLSVIKSKRADLRDLQGRIRDQIKLCQEEIGLGNHWRSRPAPGVETPDIDNAPLTDPDSLQALQALASAGDDAEVHLQPGDKTWIADEDEEEEVIEEEVIEGEVIEGEVIEGEVVEKVIEEEVVEKKAEVEPSGFPASGEAVDMDIDTLLNQLGGEEEVFHQGGEENEPAAPTLTAEEAWAGRSFDDFPLLGYCSICGEPSHETPSGSQCKNSHGGADWTEEPPTPEPEPTPEPTPEPEMEAESGSDPGKDPGSVDIFSEGGEAAGAAEIPPVASDDEVDSFFSRLNAEPAKTTKASAPDPTLAGEDLDDLMGMFGKP